MKTSSNLKLKIWTPPRSILPPKRLADVAHEGATEDEAAAVQPMETAKLDLSDPVDLRADEADVAADDRKKDPGVQKVHEIRAAMILSSWIGLKAKGGGVDAISATIREAIPMTASWTMTANS